MVPRSVMVMVIVVERRIDVRCRGDVLAFATAYAGGFLAIT
jgi:hypothetical protein